MKLKNKVAIVTGGGRCIGRGIALALAEEGADIAIIETNSLDTAFNQYLDKNIHGFDSAQETVKEIKKLGRKAIALQADVSKWDQLKAAVDQAVAEFGRLDIMVNNAGVIHAGPVDHMKEEEFYQTFDVNVKGTFFGCKAAIPHLKTNGGSIINVASIAGKMGMANMALYCSSKHAVVGFNNSLAKELAPFNINVNAICPGIVWTQMWVYLGDMFKAPGQTTRDGYFGAIKNLIPTNREQTVEDMGALALFFATNPNVTAQAVNVDGGNSIY